MALGISEALECTIFGLSIAVPSLIAFSYFSKKVEVHVGGNGNVRHRFDLEMLLRAHRPAT